MNKTSTLSRIIIRKLKDAKQKYVADYKPKGLWYQLNDSWKEWCSYEMPHWLQDYNYEYILEIDYTNILVITNEIELILFHEEYKKSIDISLSLKLIDWEKVSKKYKGIEITNYLYSMRFERDFMWYYPWDVASGCIWDKSAIKLFKQIKYEKTFVDI